jgi:formylglycine-generating enzyme required for sulfatase activity
MWWCGDSESTTHAVGQKLASPWGLLDLHGNAGEWVGDWYAAFTSAALTDPTGPAAGTSRVIRGGNWNAAAGDCRSAHRAYDLPNNRKDLTGFRLARSR